MEVKFYDKIDDKLLILSIYDKETDQKVIKQFRIDFDALYDVIWRFKTFTYCLDINDLRNEYQEFFLESYNYEDDCEDMIKIKNLSEGTPSLFASASRSSSPNAVLSSFGTDSFVFE